MLSVSDKFKKELAKPQGADIEIIDRHPNNDSFGVVMPSSVRINGVEVYIPRDATIHVHEMSADELVTVTLTVFARRVTITTENDAGPAAAKQVDD